MAAAELASLRRCEREGCTFQVPDMVEALNNILVVMTNHLTAVHPRDGGQKEVVEEENQTHLSLSWTKIFRKSLGLVGRTDLTGGSYHAKYQTVLW